MVMRCIFLTTMLLTILTVSTGFSQVEATDITKERVGPGSVGITTDNDILMSFGAQARIIPTAENNWDFGMGEKTSGFLNGAHDKSLFSGHFNEAGSVNNDYIRTEGRLFFNALPKNRKWSFATTLEFDSALETATVDERGGKTDDTSDFGIERLHVTYAMPYGMKLHAGWEIWGIDYGPGAGLVYADDNPGFWLTGGDGPLRFNVGYFKLKENNLQNSLFDLEDSNSDRDLYVGYVDHAFNKDHKAKFFYAYDRIRDVRANDFLFAISGGGAGINGGTPETDSHHIGGYYVGHFGFLEVFGEAVYQFGKAKDTAFAQGDFDINAYALSGDLVLDMNDSVGYGFKPHIGFMLTSGDDDANDDELGGYNGVVNAQRFSSRWGGENTIIGDTNLVLGSVLYGYVPELYGNGTPVFTGGLQNATGYGGGRGDNPGVTMISAGFTACPKKTLAYKTNVNSFWFNEDFVVSNFVNPALGNTTVESGYVGTEWDHEVTLLLSKNSFIKGQAAIFLPGEVIEDVTEAMSGTKSDEMASRLGLEFIVRF